MSNLADTTPAISPFFSCAIDGFDLGQWTTCSGLSIKIEVSERQDAGREFVAHRIPGKVSFGNIKLTRPVSSYTYQIMTWFQSFALTPTRTTAEIAALDQTGTPIPGLSWNLYGVMPVSWTGPSFGISGQPNIPEETLELAFKGFQP